jgi:hypothetical protein
MLPLKVEGIKNLSERFNLLINDEYKRFNNNKFRIFITD